MNRNYLYVLQALFAALPTENDAQLSLGSGWMGLVERISFVEVTLNTENHLSKMPGSA